MPIKRTPERPLRGSPEQTKERLISAAGVLFNRSGFNGTDSNEIAKAAGYATGTFYKHFRDKRAIFLAVYRHWVQSQWRDIGAQLNSVGDPVITARALVNISVEYHRKWAGLRASLAELMLTDGVVKRCYYAERRRQLSLMQDLRKRLGIPPRSAEEDAVHLFTTERVYDALARGEVEAMQLNREVVVESMVQRIAALLGHGSAT